MFAKRLWLGIGFFCLLSAFHHPHARADAGAAYRKYKGQLLASDLAMPLDVPELHRRRKTTLVRPQGSELWHTFFVGFLSKKPNESPIFLVFYDVTSGREYRGSKEINVDPNSTIVMTDVDVTEEDGVKAGKTYEVVLGVKSGGKETVFAKAKITFK